MAASSASRPPPASTSCSRRPTSTRSRSARRPTPTPTCIVAAARAGKAIFCEKPVSLDLAEVDRALAAVEEAGVPFQIGFNRRFDPAHASVARTPWPTARSATPHLVRISSRDPAPPPLDYVAASGGIFLDMTIHDFDMARFVTGSEVVEVFARGAVRVDAGVRRGRRRRHRGGHAHARERLPDDDRQLAPGRLRLRPARRGVRLGWAWRPPRTRWRTPAIVRTAQGTSAPRRCRYFFLERYMPQLPARVGGVRRGGARRARRRRSPPPTRARRW